MGQVANIQKEKRKETTQLVSKDAAIIRLVGLFNAFSTRHFESNCELGRFLEETSQSVLLDEEAPHSQNSTFSRSFVMDFLNTFEEVGRILSSASTEQIGALSKMDITESLQKKKDAMEISSKELLSGLDDLGKDFVTSNSEYEKLSDKALLSLNALGNEVIKPGMTSKPEELLKKSQACHEMLSMINAYEMEIPEQAQLINTRVFSLSNLTMAGVNETKQMLGEGIGYFFSLVSEANKIYQQCFSQIQTTLKTALDGSKTYNSQEIAFAQEDALIEAYGLKILKEEMKENEMGIEEFSRICKMIKNGEENQKDLDILAICACVEKYVEAYKEISKAQQGLYVFLKSRFERISLQAKAMNAKSIQIFKANGLASDSDSFYTLMLKTFSTQVIFEVKNFFCLHDALKKRFLVISQAVSKSADAMEGLLKSREKELSFLKVTKAMEKVQDLKTAYLKIKEDMKEKPEVKNKATEPNANSHIVAVEKSILEALKESLAIMDSFKCQVRNKDKACAQIVLEECEKVYYTFLALSEEMQVLCGAIVTFHMVAQPVEINLIGSIQIDPSFKTLSQKTFEPKEVVFKPKTDTAGLKMRLLAADEAIKKIQESQASPHSKGDQKIVSMADCLAAKMSSVPPELVALFGITESEPCKGKYSCLLLKGIMPRAGNIWLFEKKMCFHPTNSLSKSNLMIFWEDILSYELPKKNAVQVNSKHGIVTFVGFTEREAVLKNFKELGSHIQERVVTEEEIKKMKEEEEVKIQEKVSMAMASSFS